MRKNAPSVRHTRSIQNKYVNKHTLKYNWYGACRNENDSSQYCVWLHLTSTYFNWFHMDFLRGKKSNIAFKSIWFRFNFTSFLRFSYLSILCLITYQWNRSACTRGQWKRSEKNLRKCCDHTLFDIGRKTCIFHIPAQTS